MIQYDGKYKEKRTCDDLNLNGNTSSLHNF